MKRLVLGHDILKVLKDNLSDSSAIGWTHVVRVSFRDVEDGRMQPILALGIALAGMDVRRLLCSLE